MDREVHNRLADEAALFFSSQEVLERHFDVYSVSLPALDGGHIGALPEPVLLKIDPRPRVLEREVLSVSEHGEQVNLQRYEMTGISRLLFSEDDLRPDYWLIVAPGTDVTTLNANSIRPRYRNLGTPHVMQDDRRVTVVEER